MRPGVFGHGVTAAADKLSLGGPGVFWFSTLAGFGRVRARLRGQAAHPSKGWCLWGQVAAPFHSPSAPRALGFAVGPVQSWEVAEPSAASLQGS